MRQYIELVARIIDDGNERTDRTGTGTFSLFGEHLEFDLRAGFPLLTTKKVHFKSVVHELLWMLRGETHVRALQKAGVTIWNEWATSAQTARFGRQEGELGPVYGHQWRNYGATQVGDTYANDGVDQLARVVRQIRDTPDSRRLIVTGWNPREVDQVALPPCPTLFQFYVEKGRLSCHLYQRSADVFLGLPFDIASYALLTTMVATVTGLDVAKLHISIGDAHLYLTHHAQAVQQISRAPKPLPRLRVLAFSPIGKELGTFLPGDFALTDYDPHPHIAARVAV